MKKENKPLFNGYDFRLLRKVRGTQCQARPQQGVMDVCMCDFVHVYVVDYACAQMNACAKLPTGWALEICAKVNVQED